MWKQEIFGLLFNFIRKLCVPAVFTIFHSDTLLHAKHHNLTIYDIYRKKKITVLFWFYCCCCSCMLLFLGNLKQSKPVRCTQDLDMKSCTAEQQGSSFDSQDAGSCLHMNTEQRNTQNNHVFLMGALHTWWVTWSICFCQAVIFSLEYN